MTCYHPLNAYRVFNSVTGKVFISFSEKKVFEASAKFESIGLPCGKCIGCSLDHALMWTVRCMHEASLHKDNCFIILTYRDEDLPKDGNLCKRDLQLFWKRLRKKLGFGIRYFACGEYGEKFFRSAEHDDKRGRPHYHALVFNFDFTKFSDRVLFKSTKYGDLYEVPLLSDLWGKGMVVVGSLTSQSAGDALKKARRSYQFVTDDGGKLYYLSQVAKLMLLIQLRVFLNILLCLRILV